jgi:uridine kinase
MASNKKKTMGFKVAFAGGMGTGKTTLAQELSLALCGEIEVYPHAQYLKDRATNEFDMDPNKKDRALLQRLGSEMRSLDEDIFC